jgi:DNA-binding NarL/FixJ family response regulator
VTRVVSASRPAGSLLTARPDEQQHRVLVVHRQLSFGEALARRLQREPDLDVLDAVVRPARALALVAAMSVDTVVLDWALPGSAEATLSAPLRALDRPPCLVVLGDRDEAPVVAGVLRAGARAWLPQSASVDLLLTALRATMRGETYLPGAVLGPVLQHLLTASEETPAGPLDVLTERELDVLRCMVAGLDQAAIATRLYLSPNTVRTHRRRTLSKLGVHTSLEAVFIARRAGLAPQLEP